MHLNFRPSKIWAGASNNTTPLGLSSRLAAAPQGRLPITLSEPVQERSALSDLLAGGTTKRTAPTHRLDTSPVASIHVFPVFGPFAAELCYRLPPGHNFPLVCERKERGLQDLGRN